MNDIKLKSIVFNNFMAYGNNANEFTFPDGKVWVSADNGSGKSTIVEAISYAFFGTSYRGGTKNELRNTRNVEGTMRVMLEFDVTNYEGENSYRVTRTITPKGTSKFEVEKREGEVWVVQSKRAGYGQKDFEENILGFNETLFKNDIAFNTQESVPFMEMDAKSRRALLESITSVSTEGIKKETARRISAASTECDIASSDMNRISAEIAKNEDMCKRLREEKQANIEQLEQQLVAQQQKHAQLSAQNDAIVAEYNKKNLSVSDLAARLARETTVDAQISKIRAAGDEIAILRQNQEELQTAQANADDAHAQYATYPVDATRAELSNVSSAIQGLNGTISAKQREQASVAAQLKLNDEQTKTAYDEGMLLKTNGRKCPTCGKPYTDEELEPIKAALRDRYRALTANGKELTANNNSLLAEIAQLTNVDLAALTAQKTELETRYIEYDNYYRTVVVPADNYKNSLSAKVKRSTDIITSAGIDPSQFMAELERLNAEKATFPGIRAEWKEASDAASAMSNQSSALIAEINCINADIERIQKELNHAREMASGDSLALAEEQLAAARKDYAEAELRMHTASDMKLALQYISDNICADDGMKQMIFSKFVPMFNQSIERNVVKLNLPYCVEFDDSMKETFLSGPGLAPSYDMLSQGQRRKLGFAIWMAIRDFVSMIGNFKINFLSLDEVLDISTDDNAMREMLDLVTEMIDEIGCALIITHRGQVVADKFDYKMTVENDGVYSTLGELEKL